MRGGGEILGKNQYGHETFHFFYFHDNKDLLDMAINEAKEIIKIDPKLNSKRGKNLINLLYLHEKEKAVDLISAG